MKNNQDIMLIALDMDGTLLNDQGEVSVANREMIKRAQDNGIHVICSTGRSLITSREYVKSLGLSSYHITVNGSEIWDERGELVQRIVIPTAQIQWMLHIAKEYEVKFWATATDHVWRREMPEDISQHVWLKFGYEIENDEIRNKVYEKLQTRKQLLEFSNSSPINIEINSYGVNKAKGIEVVCDRLGINMSQVMAVGDSLNDLPMIQAAGIGVAMGNAQVIVKHHADWVTDSNNQDGVAKAIQKWVF